VSVIDFLWALGEAVGSGVGGFGSKDTGDAGRVLATAGAAVRRLSSVLVFGRM